MWAKFNTLFSRNKGALCGGCGACRQSARAAQRGWRTALACLWLISRDYFLTFFFFLLCSHKERVSLAPDLTIVGFLWQQIPWVMWGQRDPMGYVEPERMHFCTGGSAGQQLSWLVHNFVHHDKIE
ncbi:hypothetical protein CIB84_013744 [Bambusicola thoracicus]|uniref:Uncharacterized protein n=1 Tax=Bambusicola thoracicus TaxID=9083 RepID=A0A2P4SEH5_BAMTH|nr:hypothetical protein CIB84_013744 [Bambusicola thoracicus]